MSKEDFRMSQDDMQRQAVVIEYMLSTVQALWKNSSEDEVVALQLIEDATARAEKLGCALDGAAFEGRPK